MSSGFTWSELNNLDIIEVYQLWLALGRQRELERALTWYSNTISKIDREAREPMKLGNGKTSQRSPESIAARKVKLKEKYFRLEKPRDKKQEKQKYYNDIVMFRDFLKDAKRKNDDSGKSP